MNHFHQNQSKPIDVGIMEWLSDHSSTILIIAAVASFFITGFLEFFHYQAVFGKSLRTELAISISVMFALFFQGVRCATIANSAKKFRQNQKVRGSFILLVSLGVTIFCAYEAQQIAAIWESGHPEISGYIHLGVLCVVWAGWVLELILVVSISGEATPTPQPAQQKPNGQPAPYPSNHEFDLTAFSNGNGANH
ncbi:MAG: hypothetical protein K9J37_13580 [Saprospiraceae bacterium]|nr:hypothetical protein [Saprospiraceae bacterium]MCF8250940.1 hypothetical protein [Saprospiraceae bacterium]MCF8281918.1 hypothetical protein [Bacteroidales bacterium]MCF8311905.1 hypothetical protein [Saprospiraceae bacterium]MCF8441913.1 hypothetical protein [Saprospiraceae bacterium]